MDFRVPYIDSFIFICSRIIQLAFGCKAESVEYQVTNPGIRSCREG
jgi:hypothetical protein